MDANCTQHYCTGLLLQLATLTHIPWEVPVKKLQQEQESVLSHTTMEDTFDTCYRSRDLGSAIGLFTSEASTLWRHSALKSRIAANPWIGTGQGTRPAELNKFVLLKSVKILKSEKTERERAKINLWPYLND